ncbi:Pycsar system effector family protein [Flexithrix dorotheae]|uniref:Pycsar system effector family protein n=1 Tax=Flexithrix dorotheae TaxID=70993 RepID=UPI00037BFE9A|nr:Pycsar system effector family protein [Flexithrix dorotheae]
MESVKNSIIEDAKTFALRILQDETPKNLEYHNAEHTEEVVTAAIEIGNANGLNEEEMEILQLAAWFHDTGHSKRVNGHEEESQTIAENFLQSTSYPVEKLSRVKSAIKATKMPQSPQNLVEEVLCDADLAHLGKKGFMGKMASLRNEWHSLGSIDFNDEEWYNYNLKFIDEHNYFTEYGKTNLQPRKKKNSKKIKKKLKELNEKKDDFLVQELGVDARELKTLKKKLQKVQGRPERGIETMFRTTSRNHVDFSSMADSKANIMISVNSIIITIIIGVLMRKLDSNPHLIIPTVILLIVCLTSIVFAILATRPNVTSGKFKEEDIRNKKANLLFFGNFHKMKLSDFEWGMRELINDSDYLYGSMIRDIYFLGAVLGKKYHYLRIAYTIFMFGLIIASIAFVVATFMYNQGLTTPPIDPSDIIEDTF